MRAIGLRRNQWFVGGSGAERIYQTTVFLAPSPLPYGASVHTDRIERSAMKFGIETTTHLERAFPDEAMDLHTLGLIRVCAQPERNEQSIPAAIAWTSYETPLVDKAFFQVNVREPFASSAPIPTLRALIWHELYHIFSNHFKIGTCGTDMLIATDIEVNWWLDTTDELKLLKEMEPNCIDPTQWLEMLELNPAVPYQAEFLHELLHEKAEGMEGNRICGGIDQTDAGRASAIASIGNAIAAPGSQNSAGQAWGTGQGAWAYRPSTTVLPQWAKEVQEFARAFVKTKLGGDRKHSRPVHVLRQIGIHAPSIKSRWKNVPDTVCLLVDVSGSMYGGSVLSQLATTVGYLQRHSITVRLIAGDTRVVLDEELRGGTWPQINAGGGTDIVPLFECADKYSPKAIVCLTDTEIPTWPKNPGVPTLWVVPQGRTAPYGQVTIYLD